MGPKDTPYFGGYFFFEIEFPNNYPESSPIVNFLTIDNDVRFNPNLYEKGKVCLSILGTWEGPSWSPIMNLRLVSNSIRSLLGEYPIQNEPGFDKLKPDDIKSIEYNQYLIYHTYRLAIVDVLNNNFPYSKYFEEDIKQEFKKNNKKLLEDLLSYESIIGKSEVDSHIYFMKKSKLDFPKLLANFKKLQNN
jgi:ubiquitin-protein ligase